VSHTLVQHGELLSVVRLGPGAEVPDWAVSGTLLSATATASETSVVCAQQAVPKKARQQGPFTAFEVEGPLDLTLTGLLHELLAPLAEAEVPVFTISTFDTDWILVPTTAAAEAAEAWRRTGHIVRPAPETAEGTA
jgi:hypothetical protein